MIDLAKIGAALQSMSGSPTISARGANQLNLIGQNEQRAAEEQSQQQAQQAEANKKLQIEQIQGFQKQLIERAKTERDPAEREKIAKDISALNGKLSEITGANLSGFGDMVKSSMPRPEPEVPATAAVQSVKSGIKSNLLNKFTPESIEEATANGVLDTSKLKPISQNPSANIETPIDNKVESAVKQETGLLNSGDLTKSQRGKLAIELTNKELGVKEFTRLTKEMFESIDKDPSSVAAGGGVARFAKNLESDAKSLAKTLGIDTSKVGLTPETYTGNLGSLAGLSSSVQSLGLQLAFSMAVANGQTGRGLSDKDMERFIKIVGISSSDPQQIKSRLAGITERMQESFLERHKSIRGEDFSGELDKIENPLSNDEKSELEALRKRHGR